MRGIRLRYCGLIIAWAVAMSATLTASPAWADGKTAVDERAAQVDARIQKLIDQLGSRHYATRERAQAELASLGLAAFDALLEAQHNDNVEIALRARYLVRGMDIGWVREDDPPEIKSILRGYEQAGIEQRRSIMDRLALEENAAAVEALCRLARFETIEVLSKKAALLVMRREFPQSPEETDKLGESIHGSIGLSRRTAAQWLQAYVATTQGEGEALEQLDQLIRQEQEIFSLMPDKSSPAILGDLLLWQASVLRDRGKNREAFDVIVRRLDLLDDRRAEVMDTLDWLIHRQAWNLVDEVNTRFGARFENDPEFVYRLAEARMKEGRVEAAETYAKRAFELEPEDTREHKRLGLVLQTRGMFQWAEREYRFVMEKGPPGTLAHVEAHLYLSELLHDIQKEMEAAVALQELVDLAEKDETVSQQIQRRRGSLGPVKSRMHFFYAEHYNIVDNRKKQIEHLDLAAKADPTDADVLIAMYRVEEADEEFRQETLELIRAAAGKFWQQLELFRRQVEEAHDEEFRQWASARLASLNNQYAWLVANTEGDYDAALRCSQRSLELRPGTAGYLDTLGRCFFAKGDYENAVRVQSQAARRDPHSGAILRQLEQFQRALAEHQEKTAADGE